MAGHRDEKNSDPLCQWAAELTNPEADSCLGFLLCKVIHIFTIQTNWAAFSCKFSIICSPRANATTTEHTFITAKLLRSLL